MEFLAVIPARGGSKGIARKNLAPLAGKPLLLWTCDAARGAQTLSRSIVSTEDPEIAAAAKGAGVEVPFLRPESLARDDTPIIDVLKDIIGTLEKTERYRPDAIVLLQPTSPLRTAKHIKEAIALFTAAGADTLVSVMEVPHRFRPQSLMTMKGDSLLPLQDGPVVTQRQDKEKLYARNGPAILIVTTATLEKNSLYGQKCVPYLMDRPSSVDIDHEDDLLFASSFLLKTHAA